MTLGSLTTVWTAIATRVCRALCVVAVILSMSSITLPLQSASALDGSSIVLVADRDSPSDELAADVPHQHGRCACHAPYLAAPLWAVQLLSTFTAYFAVTAPAIGSHSPPSIMRPPEPSDQSAA